MPEFNLPHDEAFEYKTAYWYDAPHSLNRDNYLFVKTKEKERDEELFCFSYEDAQKMQKIIHDFLFANIKA